jgi:hypothetical protein
VPRLPIYVAASSLADAIIIISIASTVVFGIVPSIVCWMKGKRRWAVFGFFTAWHVVAAFRLAKPESWWARKFYDEAKLAQAKARYFEPGPRGATENVEARSVGPI